MGDRWLVVTTDSHVVKPVFFPGGDIGRLAVAGTVNDLAMMGATEVLALTCGVILEEGFPRADLERIQGSIRETCEEAGATIVTGDTKVMGARRARRHRAQHHRHRLDASAWCATPACARATASW